MNSIGQFMDSFVLLVDNRNIASSRYPTLPYSSNRFKAGGLGFPVTGTKYIVTHVFDLYVVLWYVLTASYCLVVCVDSVFLSCGMC